MTLSGKRESANAVLLWIALITNIARPAASKAKTIVSVHPASGDEPEVPAASQISPGFDESVGAELVSSRTPEQDQSFTA